MDLIDFVGTTTSEHRSSVPQSPSQTQPDLSLPPAAIRLTDAQDPPPGQDQGIDYLVSLACIGSEQPPEQCTAQIAPLADQGKQRILPTWMLTQEEADKVLHFSNVNIFVDQSSASLTSKNLA